MDIRLLPPEVIDQIAAGEVVERPAHLVKELVENSLDAGASLVEVEFAEGGRRVKVVDNGSGMAAEDLAMALNRHATSKIRSSEDLWSLSSYGFRGEALASLAAVSRLTLISRRSVDAQASKLVSEFGQRQPLAPSGGAPGTSVLVEDLFGNLPARQKFLKSETAEHSQIRATLKAFALTHPQVEFRFLESGRLWAAYPRASSLLERARQVLELDQLYEGQAEREGVRARAIFASPSDVAKSARQIWLFAQNRWIQDRGLMAAVNEAYRNLLMHGEYPIAAIWVECSSGEIDVNVHPTKSQVKFRDPSLAFRAVQASLRTRLEEAPWQGPRPLPSAVAPAGASRHEDKSFSVPEPENLRFSDRQLDRAEFQKKRDFGPAGVLETLREFAPPSTLASVPEPALEKVEKAPGIWSSLDVIGQANLTYILAQKQDALVLVDQHAAHERVVYERLMQAWTQGRIEVQEFLFPLAVDLNPEQMEALQLAEKDFQRLGLYLESLGPQTVGIKAAPALLKESVFAGVLVKTANEILERGGSFSFEKIVADLCATMACHSVVRAGQALGPEQMKDLLRQMDEFPLSGYCPHGRPVSVEIPFQRLEKDFGRLV